MGKRPPGQKREVQYESVEQVFLSDAPTANDALGFTPYVRAITRFLADSATQPPLTLSIEGKWGSGKTSFMRQLQEALGLAGFRTIWFDAWRNDSANVTWASFSLECIRQLTEGEPFWRRILLGVRLSIKRYDKARGLGEIYKFLGTGLLLLLLCGLVVTLVFVYDDLNRLLHAWALDNLTSDVTRNPWFKTTLAWAPLVPMASLVIQLLTTWWRRVQSLTAGMLTFNLRQYIRDPKYSEHVSFLNHFQEDFRLIIDVYSRKKPVCVFVDDLDRCDPALATDLMHALNLMTAADPNLIYIVAADRDKLASAFAAKYEKVLQYTDTPFGFGLSTQTGKRQTSLTFGHEFIEKFIQIPFRLPCPSTVDIARLADVRPGKPRANNRRRGRLPKAASIPFPLPMIIDPRDYDPDILLYLNIGLESDSIHRITQLVAPSLENNPRRVKQFLNLFRLQAAIAMETGMFRRGVAVSEEKALTLGQLAKFVALQQKWPHLIQELVRDDTLLARLQDTALNQSSRVDSDHWENDHHLMSLLRAGCLTTGGEISPEGIESFGMASMKINPLLSVSTTFLPVFGFEYEHANRPDVTFPIKQTGLLGVTKMGLDFWRQNKRRLGRIVEVTLDRHSEEDPWSLKLLDESGTELWLSGFSAGYGGEGPRGTLTLLLDAGFGPRDQLSKFIRSYSHFTLRGVRPDLFNGDMWTTYTPIANSMVGDAQPAADQEQE